MRKFAIISLLSLLALYAEAKPIDNAKALYEEGQYKAAADAFRAILKSSPRDITANYYLGLSLIGMGEPKLAIKPLEAAENRGSAAASKALAEIAFDLYNMDDAAEYVDNWEKQLRKNKKAIPEDLSEMRSRIVAAKNMLERVEKIVIIDSIVVDKENFFKYYQLSKDAGKLLEGSILPRQFSPQPPAVVFEPENNREVFWASPDSVGLLSLMQAQILDDGSFESPVPFGSDLGEGGDADFMFLTSDGVTFYFANNGENSIGGYDIFLSRRNADGSTLQPQNVGMPYNSPYDDYMLVIDDAAGLGWWATDRNRIPDKVTIYTFVPNQTRVNYDADDPDLADFAFVRNISATQTGNLNKNMLTTNSVQVYDESDPDDAFVLSMGNGQVYTSLSQFKNAGARSAMRQYLDRQKDLSLMQGQLRLMRQRYAQGDHSVSSDILSLEKRIEAARSMLLRLRNSAILQEK